MPQRDWIYFDRYDNCFSVDAVTPGFVLPTIFGNQKKYPDMKLCGHCGKPKPLTSFRKISNKIRPCGYEMNCFPRCVNLRSNTFKKYRNNPQSKSQAAVRLQTKKLKRQGMLRDLIHSCAACDAGYRASGGGKLELHHEVYFASAVYYLCKRHHKQLESIKGWLKFGLELWPELQSMPHTQICRNAMKQLPSHMLHPPAYVARRSPRRRS